MIKGSTVLSHCAGSGNNLRGYGTFATPQWSGRAQIKKAGRKARPVQQGGKLCHNPDTARGTKIVFRTTNGFYLSIWIIIRPKGDKTVNLSHQFVAAVFGDQQPRIGGIGLDFLPQTVDMGFQRMGRHASIIAPNLVQQHIAGHHALLRAI